MKGKVKKPWFKKPSPKASERMKRVKSIGTRLEQAMESLLKERKVKYEKQPNLRGKPDFRIKKSNVLIFCDSSFWHGRRMREITGEAFKKNKEFWVNKLMENKKRDARINRALRKEGWKVLRFWDTEILKNPNGIIKKLNLKIKNE